MIKNVESFPKIRTEQEALELCKHFQLEVRFWKKSEPLNRPEYVELQINAWTKTIGRNLVEATNRMSDLYNTSRNKYENLVWWDEYINFYTKGFSRELNIDNIEDIEDIDDIAHSSKCCELHGCEYGDENCPVVNGKIKQENTCLHCAVEGIESLSILHSILDFRKNKSKANKLDNLSFKTTSKNFPLIEFDDLHGETCSIQLSSLTTEDAIWFGISSPQPKIQTPTSNGRTDWAPFIVPEGVFIPSRMHLTRDQIEELLPILKKYAETGVLEL